MVELMITIAIAAILTTLAVPSFHRLMLNNRLNTSANALVSALQVARMDAIKLDGLTQFCGSTPASNSADTLGAACKDAVGAVYSLPHATAGGAVVAGEVRATPTGIAPPLQFGSGGVSAVRFSGQGLGYAPIVGPGTPYNTQVAIICTTQLASNNQRIISMVTGSFVTVTTATGKCS